MLIFAEHLFNSSFFETEELKGLFEGIGFTVNNVINDYDFS